MNRLTLVAACFGLAGLALAAEVPSTAFFSGNDVHQWCQRDKPMAQSYVAGLYDMAAHGATAIDNMRHWHKDIPNNDAEVDFALDRVVGYCKPDHATLEQVTDVFCKYLADNAAERDGLPAIMFPTALTKAWPCPATKK